MNILSKIVKTLDMMIEKLGILNAWLSSILVILVCYNVLMRYAFNVSKVSLTELEWHIFAALFLLGGAYAFQKDKHVRVDVFYSNFPLKIKGLVNLLGTLLFLIPFCLIVITSSYAFASNSFAFLESSPDPAGLPARYVIKSAIVFGFVLLLLQAISVGIKSAYTVSTGKELIPQSS